MTMIEHLTKDSFKRKVFDYQNERVYRFEGERPVVIDFYTNWCVPCKTIAPILEELQREYEGKVDIYKVDSDMEKELVKAFNVRSIPTLMFVPVEGQPQVGCGAVSKGELTRSLSKRQKASLDAALENLMASGKIKHRKGMKGGHWYSLA